ncbi:helix-turn-helix domain-containing protein [Streptomyces sp. MB22_4]|uniref:helix-turn-helix domain-containing protein n=1 Tax=Streptomyces sp. MB22_4 TaxID=3383120 RepID=UPI0039A1E503
MNDATERLRSAIAANLRYARHAQELSLRDLADRAGVSKALLSQLERGVANPTLEVLLAVGAALGLDLAELIRTPLYEPQVLPAHVAEAGTRTLFSSPDRRRVEFYEATVAARHSHESAPHGRGSDEFTYVVSGQVTLEVGQWSVPLRTGEAVRFSGEAEHRYVAGGRPVRLVTVLSMPSE